MEQLAEGERIREYVVEGLPAARGRSWPKASCVGHKRIEQFGDVAVSKIRLRVTQEHRQAAIIRQLAVYHVTPRP